MKLKNYILKLIVVVCLLASPIGCSTIKYVPIENNTEIHQIDSIVWHDSTVFHDIYIERYKDYVDLLDTLQLETKYSKFSAWNDATSHKLNGTAVNKTDSIPVKIKWKEKIVYRDSLVTREVPVPVEVEKKVTPKWVYYSLGVNILFLLVIIGRLLVRIYLKR